MNQYIKESVNRFLGWKLPVDFSPDAGITFKREANVDSPIECQYKHEPIGTNLFNAKQAEAMLSHVAKPLTDKIEALESDLQLQTKVFIAACENLALIAEKLGINPEDGGASPILDKISELEAQLADAKQAARWESDLASQAIADLEPYRKDAERLAYLDSLATYSGRGFMGGIHRLEFEHESNEPNSSFYAAIDAAIQAGEV